MFEKIQQFLPTPGHAYASALYIEYVGLDSKFDQIYITISFHPSKLKFKYTFFSHYLHNISLILERLTK